MKKKIVNYLIMTVIAASMVVLAGCGKNGKGGKDDTADNGVNAAATEEASDKADKAAAEEETTANAEDEEQDLSRDVASLEFETVYNNECTTEKAVLTAYNNEKKVLWTFETDEIYLSELEPILDIGEVPDGYCFIADGKVYKITTTGTWAGQYEWINESFDGAGASCYVDDRDNAFHNFYLCGYYGPDLMIIDNFGETVNRFEKIDYSSLEEEVNEEEFIWPHNIELKDGLVAISFFGNDSIVYVDPKTGKAVSYEIIEYSDEDEYADMRLSLDEIEGDSLDDFRSRLSKTGSKLAVAYLGYGSEYYDKTMDDVMREAEETYANVDFLNDLSGYKSVAMPGGEAYVIIPADKNGTFKVYEMVWDEEGNYTRGKVQYKSKPGEIVIVSGNVSEIAPNIEIVMEDNGQEFVYEPYISMRDGLLQMKDGITDISVFTGDFGEFEDY